MGKNAWLQVAALFNCLKHNITVTSYVYKNMMVLFSQSFQMFLHNSNLEKSEWSE